MVKLIVGEKGTGKTKTMIDLANEKIEDSNGSIIFISKSYRLMYDIKHSIRIVSMDDYDEITNSDEYIGFIYGIVSSDHDIETIFIDSILKHADVNPEDLPEFLARLDVIGSEHEIEFVVSISAEMDEVANMTKDYELIAPTGC